MSNAQPEHLRNLDRKSVQRPEPPARYDPLATCPPEKRDRYENASRKAKKGHWTAILKLKCLECVCWDAPEVKRCEIDGCALWAYTRKDLAG